MKTITHYVCDDCKQPIYREGCVIKGNIYLAKHEYKDHGIIKDSFPKQIEGRDCDKHILFSEDNVKTTVTCRQCLIEALGWELS